MYKTILYATDLKQEHYHLCEKAKAIADQFDADLYLLHVIELPTSLQLAQSLGFTQLANPVTDDAVTVMSILGEAIKIPKSRQIVEIGTPSHHIFEKIKALDCDLLIIGSHSIEALSPFLGSTASATVHHSSCDVMTLRN